VTLRPIHVIRSGLARLGRGELDVSVDLPSDAELAELGDSFKAVSARLAADRSELAGQRATLESVVDNLEDAVALFNPAGVLLFANPAMSPVLSADSGPIETLLPDGHPYRVAVETALASGESLDPTTVQMPGGGERLVLAHPVEDAEGQRLGVMLVARNLTYLTQVESTLAYSRKLAALGRLSAGIAHEVKNPLNATMIHLELLKMQLAESPAALEHLAVIATQVRRLDEVVQGFLKFTRPEDLQLQPVPLLPLIEELMPVVSAEASKSGVDVRLEFPPDLPPASADPGLLQQAFLNLALNACQAMPSGGRLRIAGALTPSHQVAVTFEDTGVGITPEQLARIFDLYFTTKEHGSGIGLSLVYRTVQLHDGDIEVQSVPGRGTTFRVLLREAPPAGRRRALPSGPLGLRDTESTPAGSLG
jgi:signal transduction histidine kinase